jgi:ankyrin repeat protein
MCAAAWGHAEVAKALVERGADPDRKDKRGGTAYDIACEKGEDEVAEFLKPL